MFFTILQAMHGGKVIFFLDTWEEGDPDCKLLIIASYVQEKVARKILTGLCMP
jgi:hypothetical protein